MDVGQPAAARIEPGESVLVHAAAGGVGSQLGQTARLLGAGRVVGSVGSPAKIETAQAFGYDEVVLREQIAEVGQFDVVVDLVGGPARRSSLDLLAPMGRMVVMGNASGAEDNRSARIRRCRWWVTRSVVVDMSGGRARGPGQDECLLSWPGVRRLHKYGR
ncbi:zinc-binding dehydrogenase [Nonomuraea sp. NPDC049784]|uniref:zinc-binding dehydrogenase n=1 Tax=Nonomuraea sp. NPDC049784 TaxID=3154361 RepID=UPI0033D5B477